MIHGEPLLEYKGDNVSSKVAEETRKKNQQEKKPCCLMYDLVHMAVDMVYDTNNFSLTHLIN